MKHTSYQPADKKDHDVGSDTPPQNDAEHDLTGLALGIAFCQGQDQARQEDRIEGYPGCDEHMPGPTRIGQAPNLRRAADSPSNSGRRS